jgi:hypothetical protein
MSFEADALPLASFGANFLFVLGEVAFFMERGPSFMFKGYVRE